MHPTCRAAANKLCGECVGCMYCASVPQISKKNPVESFVTIPCCATPPVQVPFPADSVCHTRAPSAGGCKGLPAPGPAFVLRHVLVEHRPRRRHRPHRASARRGCRRVLRESAGQQALVGCGAGTVRGLRAPCAHIHNAYIHIHTHTHTHMHTHAYTYAYTYTRTHACIHTHYPVHAGRA